MGGHGVGGCRSPRSTLRRGNTYPYSPPIRSSCCAPARAWHGFTWDGNLPLALAMVLVLGRGAGSRPRLLASYCSRPESEVGRTKTAQLQEKINGYSQPTSEVAQRSVSSRRHFLHCARSPG